jgi:fructose-1,6-bisphosphatase/inositol monophosphatase family enzyme
MLADSRINYRRLREAIRGSMKQVLVAPRPELMAQRNFHSIDRTLKDIPDRTRAIDVTALNIYTHDLQNRLPGTPVLVCSEENPGGTTLTSHPELPDLLFIIDPIDNTDGAIHGSPCYTALSVYLRSRSTVIAAAVGDFRITEDTATPSSGRKPANRYASRRRLRLREEAIAKSCQFPQHYRTAGTRIQQGLQAIQ